MSITYEINKVKKRFDVYGDYEKYGKRMKEIRGCRKHALDGTTWIVPLTSEDELKKVISELNSDVQPSTGDEVVESKSKTNLSKPKTVKNKTKEVEATKSPQQTDETLESKKPKNTSHEESDRSEEENVELQSIDSGSEDSDDSEESDDSEDDRKPHVQPPKQMVKHNKFTPPVKKSVNTVSKMENPSTLKKFSSSSKEENHHHHVENSPGSRHKLKQYNPKMNSPSSRKQLKEPLQELVRHKTVESHRNERDERGRDRERDRDDRDRERKPVVTKAVHNSPDYKIKYSTERVNYYKNLGKKHLAAIEDSSTDSDSDSDSDYPSPSPPPKRRDRERVRDEKPRKV
jgi:hypothetical protein